MTHNLWLAAAVAAACFATALVMHVTKLIVFGAAAVLTWRTGLTGVALASTATAGAWTGKKVLDRLPVDVFVVLVEIGLAHSSPVAGRSSANGRVVRRPSMKCWWAAMTSSGNTAV
jgi:hypothetical protein